MSSPFTVVNTALLKHYELREIRSKEANFSLTDGPSNSVRRTALQASLSDLRVFIYWHLTVGWDIHERFEFFTASNRMTKASFLYSEPLKYRCHLQISYDDYDLSSPMIKSTLLCNLSILIMSFERVLLILLLVSFILIESKVKFYGILWFLSILLYDEYKWFNVILDWIIELIGVSKIIIY